MIILIVISVCRTNQTSTNVKCRKRVLRYARIKKVVTSVVVDQATNGTQQNKDVEL